MSASTGPKDSPENTHFSDEELRACVEEARRRQVFLIHNLVFEANISEILCN